MALSLTCNCSPGASLCNLTQLVWRVNVERRSTGVGAVWTVTLLGTGVSEILIDPGNGADFSVDLTPLATYVAGWGSLAVELFVDQSTTQVPDPARSEYETFRVEYSIEQHYQCINLTTGQVTNRVVRAQTVLPGDEAECNPGGTDLRGVVFGGKGGILEGVFYKSSPLGACFSGGISTQNSFFRPLLTPTVIDVDNSGNICLCATGGTGDYIYSIFSGNLPCGQHLNSITGCIEGEPDGSCPASDEVVFRVTDAGGAGSPGDQTVGGACVTSGNVVTLAVNPSTGAQDGPDFVPAMVGAIIRVYADGTELLGEVGGVSGAQSLYLIDSIGTFGTLSPYQPVGWSMTYPLPSRILGGDPTTVTLSGTCRTFGYGATRLSGDDFDLVVMAGGSITIGGVVYGLASVDDVDHVTLTTTAPVQDPISWSFTYEIPGEGPHVPETAEVTCGLTGTGCDGSGTTHNFFH